MKKTKLAADKTYIREVVTYQESLTSDEIKKKLEGYKKVSNISEVPIDTHLRYFIKNPNGETSFRLGGFLHNKENCEKYVVLSNGKKTWSVQIPNTIFYQKLSHKEEIAELHEYYRKKLEKKDKRIRKLEEALEK